MFKKKFERKPLLNCDLGGSMLNLNTWRLNSEVVSASDFRADGRNIRGSVVRGQVGLFIAPPVASPKCINGYRPHTAGGNSAMDLHPIQGGVAIILVTLCYRKPG